MKKRILSMLLALTMTVSMAVGCSSNSGSDKSSTDDKKTEATKEETKSVFTKSPTGKTNSGVVTYNVDMTQYEDGKYVSGFRLLRIQIIRQSKT